MNKNRILVTGASGFIGRNIAEYFAASGSCEVFACTDEVADLRAEAAVDKIMREFLPDVVINCAAIGGTRKTGYDQGNIDVVASNLRIFFNLARHLKPGMRMLHIGSGAEYDKRYCLPKMAEDYFDTHVPADDYGYAKYVISKYIEKTDNITCLRIFGLYGKYEDYTYKFISNAIVKNLLGLPIAINQNVKFDYLWIEDFCKIVQRFLEIKPKYAHYNITPTESVDLRTLAEAINSVSRAKSEIRVLNAGMNTEYTGSNQRILEELNGFNFTSHEKGVKKLYAYYALKFNELDLDTIKKDPYLKLCKKSDGVSTGDK